MVSWARLVGNTESPGRPTENQLAVPDWLVDLGISPELITAAAGSEAEILDTRALQQLQKVAEARESRGETSLRDVARAAVSAISDLVLTDLATSNAPHSAMDAIFKRIGPIDEEAVGRCLYVMASRPDGSSATPPTSQPTTAIDEDDDRAASDALALDLLLVASAATEQSHPLDGSVIRQAPSHPWPVTAFIDAVLAARVENGFPPLNLDRVILAFDNPTASLSDAQTSKAVDVLLTLAKRLTPSASMLPPSPFAGRRWKNTKLQLSFLFYILGPQQQRKPEVDWASLTPKSQVVEGVDPQPIWSSLPLLETLLSLAEGAEAPLIQNLLLEGPCRQCPETLLLGLVACRPRFREVQHLLLSTLIASVMATSSRMSKMVLQAAWLKARMPLINGMAEMWKRDPKTVPGRILDLVEEMDVLEDFLSAARPFHFSLDVAVLAAGGDTFNFEKWMITKVELQGSPFVLACISYLADKTASGALTASIEAPNVEPGASLSLRATAEIFKCLHASIATMPPELVGELRKLYASSIQSSPALAEVTKSDGAKKLDKTTVTRSTNEMFAADVEKEANQCFQQIYTGNLQVVEAIAIMSTYKASLQQREAEIFQCMVHNLFDESRFWHRYPDHELALTGDLFGSLIKADLLSTNRLVEALRYILDALRSPPPNRLLQFGVRALEQFQERFTEWPQYCAQLLQLPHLRQVVPKLTASIDKAHKEGSSENAPSPALPKSSGAENVTTGGTGGTLALSPSIDTNLANSNGSGFDLPTADENTQDRVNFIFNNLSSSNMEQKTVEFMSFYSSGMLDYLSNHLVTKRAMIEPNYHTVYVGFLERIHVSIPELLKNVLSRSYANVSRLLKSPKIRSSYQERILLKNLGSWIGALTLGRNKAIFAKDLDIKYLLLDAYSRGMLVPVMPFISKVMESCQVSRVFKPPNPWVVTILGIMKEIYAISDLKLSLKFEVEVLLKHLGSPAVSPTDLLKTKACLGRTENPDLMKAGAQSGSNSQVTPGGRASPPTGSPEEIGGPSPVTERTTPTPFNLHTLVQSMPSVDNTGRAPTAAGDRLPGSNMFTGSSDQPGVVPIPSVVPNPGLSGPFSAPPAIPMAAPTQPANSVVVADGVTVIPNLAQHITINPSLVLFQSAPRLKQLVPLAVDRAVREIIQPVVERSCTIACITTQELVTKDFGSEPEENRVRTAAHQMVQNLAGSLALVTCKEPLRSSMGNHLRSLLTAHSSGIDQNVIEHSTMLVSSENIDVGCRIIERAAVEKAGRDIDDAMLPAYTLRRHAHPAGNSQTEYPTVQQIRVYDDFAQPQTAGNNGIGLPPTAHNVGQATSASSEGSSIEKFSALYTMLNDAAARLVSTFSGATLSDVPNNHEIRRILAQVHSLSLPEDVALTLAHKLYNLLFECDSNLQREIHTALLEALRVTNPQLPRDFAIWLSRADDRRKVNRDAIVGMLRAGLLEVADFDNIISNVVSGGRNIAALDLAAFLARRIVIDNGLGPNMEMPATLEVLTSLISQGRNPSLPSCPDGLNVLVAMLRSKAGLGIANPSGMAPATAVAATAAANEIAVNHGTGSSSSDPAGFRSKLASLFTSWDKLFRNKSQQDRSGLVKQIMNLIGSQESDRELFYRSATEVAFEKTYRSLDTKDASAYDFVDALAELVVAMLSGSGPEAKQGVPAGLPTLNTVLVVTWTNLTNTKAQTTVQNEFPKSDYRPQFRFLSDLLTHMGSESGPIPLSPTLDEDEQPPSSMTSAASLSNLQVLSLVASTLHALRPTLIPGFAFSWIELISHRSFMPRLLTAKGYRGWPLFHRLLVDLLTFVAPHLRSAYLSEPMKNLYVGILRVLLVLLHDFPEFLCDYHYSLCDEIPSCCVQLRNLILSAFPRTMRLPDPFLPDLAIESIPEMLQRPSLSSNYLAALTNSGLQSTVDLCLSPAANPSLMNEIIAGVRLTIDHAGSGSESSSGGNYNILLINSIVMHVGMQTVKHLEGSKGLAGLPQSPHYAFLSNLLLEVDHEGRYHILNAMANQLRYPNNHTHLFSSLLLTLFGGNGRIDAGNSGNEVIPEQVTRVLMERLIANRPQPWGLLVTFIELIKNPRYSFWSHGFVHCAPEIEKLFENVAQSCMGGTGGVEGMGAGGAASATAAAS